MDSDDTKNLYEVTNENYDEKEFPQPHIQINDRLTTPKWQKFVLIGFLAIISFLLVIILGVTAVTYARLHTSLPLCTESTSSNNGNTDSLTSTDSNTNQQLEQIANMSKAILAMQRNSSVNDKDYMMFLQEFSQITSYNVTQLMNIVQRTEGLVSAMSDIAESQAAYTLNMSDVLNQVLNTTGNSAAKLTNIVSTLSNIKDTGTSTAGVIDDILLVVEELLTLQNASSLFDSILPVSCKDIKKVLPSSPSGYYHVNARNIYCNMDELCGEGGGWTRLAYLDMSDATVNCPTNFGLYVYSGLRTCGRAPTNFGSCDSEIFQTHGISYSQICGKAVGYQLGTPDGVSAGIGIDSWYMDGVSITRGSPRQHVWTLMCGVHQNKNYPDNCPCAGGTNVQSFVGNDYFCESGNPTDSWASIFYSSDPLWDGQGCGSHEAGCCSTPGQPWFHKSLSTNTTDYIEMRLCGSEDTINEDVKLTMYEIYVK